MSYFTDYYMEKFEYSESKAFVILLRRVEIHDKQKYLLIVAQELVSHKIVKLVDTFGAKYDLCKYSLEWVQLKKGDIISVECAFHQSAVCANVLRIKSNYILLGSVEYYTEIKNTQSSFIKVFETDLEYLGKKLEGKHGFILYRLMDSPLNLYTKAGSNKSKYQFLIRCQLRSYYADIVSNVPEIDKRNGNFYSGFCLLQFAYKNGHLRAKVYDFLNEDEAFYVFEPFSFSEDFEELKEPVNSPTNQDLIILDDDLPF